MRRAFIFRVDPSPSHHGLDRFRDVQMPADFVLECLTPEGTWIDWGRYQATAFERCDDGTYLCSGHAGSPMWIRCLRQDGSVIYVVDGGGDPYTYRLVPFPSHAYWETGGPRPEAEHDGLRFDEAGDPYVSWEDVERMTASIAPGETLELPEDVRIRQAPGDG